MARFKGCVESSHCVSCLSLSLHIPSVVGKKMHMNKTRNDSFCPLGIGRFLQPGVPEKKITDSLARFLFPVWFDQFTVLFPASVPSLEFKLASSRRQSEHFYVALGTNSSNYSRLISEIRGFFKMFLVIFYNFIFIFLFHFILFIFLYLRF